MPRTRILKVHPEQPEPSVIRQAAMLIRAGKLVAFPTETVYGLGANALDAAAVRRIFRAKGRPPTDPLIVHIAELDQLAQVAEAIPAVVWEMAVHFWPGPLTFVLPKSAIIPTEVTAGNPTVAVRWPAHAVAQALIRESGVPIAAPSANLFGHTSPTTAQHVYADLHGRLELILDGGATHIGLESTILDVSRHPPAVLRPGGVPLEALRHFLPEVALLQTYRSGDERLDAPGQALRHYAPHATLVLFDGEGQALILAMRKAAQEQWEQGKRVGILVTDEEVTAFAGVEAEVFSLGPRDDLQAVGRNLFAALRQLESRNVEVILARTFPRQELGLTIWDRLYRAAQGRVVKVEG